MVLHEDFQERDAVHPRHLDIEREHVGLELDNFVPRDKRVDRCADDFDLRIRIERVAGQLAHDRGVVHDENADFAAGEAGSRGQSRCHACRR